MSDRDKQLGRWAIAHMMHPMKLADLLNADYMSRLYDDFGVDVRAFYDVGSVS